MNYIVFILTLTASFGSLASNAGQEGEISFHWEHALVTNTIHWYEKHFGLHAVVSSEVRNLAAVISFDTGSSPVSNTEASKGLKKALMEQAGVIITEVDEHTISVTYNDALVPALKQKQPVRGGGLRKRPELEQQ